MALKRKNYQKAPKNKSNFGAALFGESDDDRYGLADMGSKKRDAYDKVIFRKNLEKQRDNMWWIREKEKHEELMKEKRTYIDRCFKEQDTKQKAELKQLFNRFEQEEEREKTKWIDWDLLESVRDKRGQPKKIKTS